MRRTRAEWATMRRTREAYAEERRAHAEAFLAMTAADWEQIKRAQVRLKGLREITQGPTNWLGTHARRAHNVA